MEPLVHTPLPQLRAARAVLHAQGAVATHLLHAPLARSWQRCLHAGLRPDSACGAALVHGEGLRSALVAHDGFLVHARPVLNFLHELIRGTGNLVVLADAQGLLLHAQGDDSFVDRAERVALRPGACWAEHARGTNAIGTALVEATPVVVHADEHFLDDNGFLTCAAAPVFDSRGRALGVVDVSGEQRGRHPHTLALVRSAARMIEDRVFSAEHASHVRLHLHAQAEGLTCVGAGLVALTDDGWIVGANGVARGWLGLQPSDVGACTIMAALGVAMEELLAGAGRPRLLHLPSGSRLWSRAELPAPRVVGVQLGAELATSAEDPQVARARHRAERALDAGLTLLLQGESGTGKDVFARALHEAGPRRRGSFVAVNCASLPETLIEAELFGYVGGAFTGARREGAPGRFREAHGGTLFLDEIGDMPLALQTRLLRVLEERKVSPLGSSKSVPVDVQLIGATHRDLRAAVAAGTFRDDLYYRLAGLTVALPPLRERQDFDALCAAMLRELRADAPPRLAADVAAAMRRFAWPGNLRQLRSALAVAAAMLEPHEAVIDWQHLPDDVRGELRGERVAPVPVAAAPQALRALSDRAIADAVAACGHNMSEAARRLGISRNTLYRRLRQLGER